MVRAGISVLLASFSSVAMAHHSFGAFFDVDNVGEIEGELIEVFWVNPHTTFTVRTDDGETWTIETAPVNRLQRLGLANTVDVGDRVGFYGAMSRLGRNEILAINMTMPGGDEVLLDPGLTGRFVLAGPMIWTRSVRLPLPHSRPERPGTPSLTTRRYVVSSRACPSSWIRRFRSPSRMRMTA